MVKSERFTSVLREGHKGCAVELPFDPADRWTTLPRQLWPGRRGHHVAGLLNGVPFVSTVVPRSRRFWVLVDAALQTKARVYAGDTVTVSIAPRELPAAKSVTRAVAKSAPKSSRASKSKPARRKRS